MPLTLELKCSLKAPLELAVLTPDWAMRRTVDRIAHQVVACGRERLALGDLFAIRGDQADGHIELSGDLTAVHRLGARMTSGEIHVEGSVGRHLGAEMSGGRIEVSGTAGDWLGAEMRGGSIHVRGSAGNHAAGAYPGSSRGVVGGEILIDGDAGHDLGRAMRRGLVAVGGSVGEDLGARLLAGTIIVGGACGRRVGAEMRRGTLALLGPPPELLPTFVAAGRCRPTVMQLLLSRLRQTGFAVPKGRAEAEFVLHHGDLLALGRGEILLAD